MKKVTSCRCCASKELFMYLNLGKQPLANSYHKGGKLPLYPLEVLVCQNCFHNQLSVVIEPQRMFKNYLYVSGTTTTFRNHCKTLAQDAVKRVEEKKEISVLDIACNDGTLLEYFRELGCKVFGIDPAENLRRITLQKSIPVLVDYWGENAAKKLGKTFTIITGTNVFAHVDRADLFLKACSMALDDNGILILEFPYCNTMIEHNEFDTIYHEHLSYFLVNSFATLAKRMNFHIVNLLQTPIHGGSIRFFLKKGNKRHNMKVMRMITEEEQKGLFRLSTYKRFTNNVIKNKQMLKSLVSNIKNKGKKVIGYGASAKGNTMLNYFKLNLSYIIDDNDLKWGLLTPGRNILIKPPHILQEEKNSLYIIILSWNFYSEIVKKIKAFRNKINKDYCILYVPKVQKTVLYDQKN